jgi:hypothetical protein
MRITAVVLFLVASLASACAPEPRIVTIEDGVFKWVSSDSSPNQFWRWKGKLQVTLLDGYVIVVREDEKVIVPSQRVLYIGDGTDPGAWE